MLSKYYKLSSKVFAFFLFQMLMFVSAFHKDLDLAHERPENFHLEKVEVFNKTFFVGSVHHGWVLSAEMGNLMSMHRGLKDKEGRCMMMDVGMNDGFYTQLAAHYGCKVYSFEVQESCIALSRQAVVSNNVSHLVNIYRAPVSRQNGEVLRFPHGPADHQQRCDGMNSISGVSHKKYTVEGYYHFHAVSLDGFVPWGVDVDFIKVDVEGFDPAVMEGAMGLFKSHRIRRAVVEIDTGFWQAHEIEGNIEPYRRIIEDFGYKFLCVTERPKNTDWDVVKPGLAYKDFHRFVRQKSCVDWEFFV